MPKQEHELLIQWVTDGKGKPWLAVTAPEGEKYYCCDCGEPLKRRGNGPPHGYTRHFAHIDSSNCTGETDIHRVTKLWIAHLLQSRVGDDSVVEYFNFFNKEFADWENIPLLPTHTEVKVEQRLPNGYRPDVSLWMGSKCVFAIEVRHTHPVDAKKEEALGIPWIEVLAETELIEDTVFKVVNGSQDYFPVVEIELDELDWEVTYAKVPDFEVHHRINTDNQPSAASTFVKQATRFGLVIGLSAAFTGIAAHSKAAPFYYTSLAKDIRRSFGERTWFEKLLGV
jgi:hypothetical protein